MSKDTGEFITVIQNITGAVAPIAQLYPKRTAEIIYSLAEGTAILKIVYIFETPKEYEAFIIFQFTSLSDFSILISITGKIITAKVRAPEITERPSPKYKVNIVYPKRPVTIEGIPPIHFITEWIN